MTDQDILFSSAVLETELHNIAHWWLDNAFDKQNGGLVGCIGLDGKPDFDMEKSVILHTRTLWFFSEVYRLAGRQEYLDAADRIFVFIQDKFADPEYGGFFWELSSSGVVAKAHKQTYGQAFAIYALCAYHRVSPSSGALAKAQSVFDLIESAAHDPIHGGYLEGLSRDWKPLEDMRLSEFDINSPKTMNNHLHVLEAYTLLYSLSGDESVGKALRELLHHFLVRIISKDGALQLFFTLDWQPINKSSSPGHDIEAVWLLMEACDALSDPEITLLIERVVKVMAEKAVDIALQPEGYLVSEIDDNGCLELISSWWAQAEALVGFLWAFDLTKDPKFYDAAAAVWQFIVREHVDHENGEWFWSARSHPHQEGREYKAGPWKGPYHNGRSMMEGARLLAKFEASGIQGVGDSQKSYSEQAVQS